ncbi:MAG: hypothetical protein R3E67_08375 [Pseudomonadales bacterium]
MVQMLAAQNIRLLLEKEMVQRVHILRVFNGNPICVGVFLSRVYCWYR